MFSQDYDLVDQLSIVIDLNDYASGVYQLKLITPNGHDVNKLFIVN